MIREGRPSSYGVAIATHPRCPNLKLCVARLQMPHHGIHGVVSSGVTRPVAGGHRAESGSTRPNQHKARTGKRRRGEVTRVRVRWYRRWWDARIGRCGLTFPCMPTCSCERGKAFFAAAADIHSTSLNTVLGLHVFDRPIVFSRH